MKPLSAPPGAAVFRPAELDGGLVDTAGFLLQGLFTEHVTGNFVNQTSSRGTMRDLAMPVFDIPDCAINGNLGLQCFELVPTVKSAMCHKSEDEKVIHGVSLSIVEIQRCRRAFHRDR
jgi:hypothetical protein